MSRLTDVEIDRMKRETDLVALVQSRGIKLEKHGSKDWKGLCPFHKDSDTPNFIVSPEKGLWHCMACGKAGNPIQFIQHHDGISFRHAYEVLRTAASAQGSKVAYQAKPLTKQTTVPILPCPLDPEADDATLLQQVATYYTERLKATPAVREYLASRGLDSDELIDRYQLGLADRTLGLRLPEANRKTGELLRSRLTQLGVWRQSGHEHFNGCLVVPLLAAGKIVSFYGRRIGPGTVKHLYSPGPHQGLFNPEAFHHEEIILCEAVIDALTFCANGFTNVSCLYGTEGWTEEHTAALKTVKRVRLAYDADEAGDRAAERDTKRLQDLGIEVYRIKFPWGMDANEYARKVSPAAKSLALLVNAAEWCGQGKAPAVIKAKNTEDPPRVKEAWEQVPREIAEPLAKELGQPLKGVAMEMDEYGERLPFVSKESLKTGHGWTEQPYCPAPMAEVEQQQEQLRQIAQERGLLPSTKAQAPEIVPPAPSPSSLAAFVSCSVSTRQLSEEEAAKKGVSTRQLDALQESSAPAIPQLSLAPVSPLPPSLEQRGEAWFLSVETREYRVTGLAKTVGSDSLKIGLRIQSGERFHLDQIDLIRDTERRRYIERAAEETGLNPELLKRDMSRLLLAVEQAQIELSKPVEAAAKIVNLTPEERDQALQWLKAPNLIGRLKEAFHLAGIIGEETNTLVAYLAGVSRKLEKPLAIIIQSASAAGKSTLMDAVLAFFPEEDRIKYSAMTGQSLYYLGENNLQHKILAVVEEAGAEKASYAMKLLQSEGELTIASTGKDPQTGRMTTQEYHVQGPVMLFLTTTSVNLDEELQNRCLTLAVDESAAQTERIHKLQRERRTLAGLIAKEERKEVLVLLKNAQRLLTPCNVLNPYATELTFPSHQTRNRRDHDKYLTLIDAITLLHQHQRQKSRHVVKGREVEYIVTTIEDIALANEIAPEVLGRSLDELPPQTRLLLEIIRASVTLDPVRKMKCFTRREIKNACGWSLTQVRVHLERLVELEYLALRCGRLGSSFSYELLIEVDAPCNIAHIGLIDVETLRKTYAYNEGVAEENGPVAGDDKTALPAPTRYKKAA